MKTRIKASVVGYVGNTLEYYDFSLYASFSPFIARHFFPPDLSAHLTLITLALAFFMRPIGSILFGYIGDVYGRKKAFGLPMVLVAIFTFSMAIIPSYQEIGLLSSALLIFARLGQGFCIGGEYGGAVVFTLEHQRNKNLGFIAGMLGSSVLLGNLLANVLSFVFTLPVFPEYFWRVPFFIGASIGIVGAWVRFKAEESPEFRYNPNHKIPLFVVITQYPLSIVRVMMCSGLSGLLGTFVFVYLNFFMVTNLAWPINKSLGLSSCALFIAFVTAPLVGLLNQRYSALKIINLCCLACILIIPPAFYHIASNQLLPTIISMFFLALLVGTCWGSINVLLYHSFPTEVRYTGVAFCDSVGRILFSAPIPFICNYVYTSAADSDYQNMLTGVVIAGIILLIATLLNIELFLKVSRFRVLGYLPIK